MESFLTIPPESLTDEQIEHGRDHAANQMEWTRQYSMQLIESIPDPLWYAIPEGNCSHVAWQVGHLAVAQYGLMLFRQRGRLSSDRTLMPGWLRKQFGRGSTPAAADARVPNRAELLDKLHAIHRQSLHEIKTLTPTTLREPIDMPFAVYPIKLGALLFAPIHEAIHAGHIGTLRRQHGLAPIR